MNHVLINIDDID